MGKIPTYPDMSRVAKSLGINEREVSNIAPAALSSLFLSDLSKWKRKERNNGTPHEHAEAAAERMAACWFQNDPELDLRGLSLRSLPACLNEVPGLKIRNEHGLLSAAGVKTLVDAGIASKHGHAAPVAPPRPEQARAAQLRSSFTEPGAAASHRRDGKQSNRTVRYSPQNGVMPAPAIPPRWQSLVIQDQLRPLQKDNDRANTQSEQPERKPRGQPQTPAPGIQPAPSMPAVDKPTFAEGRSRSFFGKHGELRQLGLKSKEARAYVKENGTLRDLFSESVRQTGKGALKVLRGSKQDPVKEDRPKKPALRAMHHKLFGKSASTAEENATRPYPARASTEGKALQKQDARWKDRLRAWKQVQIEVTGIATEALDEAIRRMEEGLEHNVDTLDFCSDGLELEAWQLPREIGYLPNLRNVIVKWNAEDARRPPVRNGIAFSRNWDGIKELLLNRRPGAKAIAPAESHYSLEPGDLEYFREHSVYPRRTNANVEIRRREDAQWEIDLQAWRKSQEFYPGMHDPSGGRPPKAETAINRIKAALAANAEELDLSDLRLTSVPREIGYLPELKKVHVRGGTSDFPLTLPVTRDDITFDFGDEISEPQTQRAAGYEGVKQAAGKQRAWWKMGRRAGTHRAGSAEPPASTEREYATFEPPLSGGREVFGFGVPTKIFNARSVSIARVAAALNSGQSHHKKAMAGSGNNCWWRAALLSVFVQQPPRQLEERIISVLGDDAQQLAAVAGLLAEAVQNDIASVLTRTRNQLNGPFDTPATFKFPEDDDDDNGIAVEMILKDLADRLLGKPRFDQDEVGPSAAGEEGEPKQIFKLMEQLGMDGGVVFHHSHGGDSNSYFIVSHTADSTAAGRSAFAGDEDHENKAACTQSLIDRLKAVPVIVHRGAHFDVYLPNAGLGSLMRRV